MSLAKYFILVPCSIAVLAQTSDVHSAPPTPLEIIEKAVNADIRNFNLIRNYTMNEDRTEREFDDNGNVVKTKVLSYEILYVEGVKYTRLTGRDGQPLSADNANREDKKLQEFAKKQSRRSQEDRAKEAAKEAESRRKFMELLPAAFDLVLTGEKILDGRRVYVIQARRKEGFKPKGREQALLAKLQGSLWIDAEDFQFAKIDAEVVEMVSIGWFVARLQPGARILFEQKRVNDHVWLPNRMVVRGDIRVIGIKKRLEGENVFSNYRRFQADSRVL